MGVKPGYKIPVGITTTSTTAAAGDRLPNVKSFSFPRSRVKIDTSNPKDAASDASRRTVVGLYEGEPSVTLHWDPADTICARIETAFAAGTSVWFQYTNDNTWGASTGHKQECLVTGIELSNDAEGSLMGTVNFAPNGAPVSL